MHAGNVRRQQKSVCAMQQGQGITADIALDKPGCTVQARRMDDEAQERRQRALAKVRAAVIRAGGPRIVAIRIGTTRSHVWNVISDTRDLGRETALRLRRALRIDAGTLLDLMIPREPPRPPKASNEEVAP